MFLSFSNLGLCAFITVYIVGPLCLCTLASSTQLNLLRASVHSRLVRVDFKCLRPEGFVVVYDSASPFPFPLYVSSCYTPSARYELFSMQTQHNTIPSQLIWLELYNPVAASHPNLKLSLPTLVSTFPPPSYSI
jgi:hypothetical protein